LYGCKEGACDDLSLCYKFLDDLVTKLKMTKQSPPFIFKSDECKYPDKAGLSGWVPLIESGIQMHTLTPKNFISVDIYSCREFSVEHISGFVKKYFAPKEIEVNYIERGLKYNDIE
jgi:S-adenosylmethionine decarboxylase